MCCNIRPLCCPASVRCKSAIQHTGYRQISPNYWTADHVLEWISDQVESTKFDANTLSLANCAMDGSALCQMNREQMIGIFGVQLGPHLYQSLQEHKTKMPGKSSGHQSLAAANLTPSSLTLRFQVSKQEKQQQKTFEVICIPFSREHTPRGTHLWEFIRDILIHPEKNQGLMKWEDRREGVFKFLKSEAVAQMWGQKKKNSSMTYEKLSRAMRYYYKREILERVDGRRLVYKFGKNSSGWKIEEIGMTM
uniref:E74-like factor 3 (ets domain transcription factor, epithelial-specific ) n=1 Tax=Neolamprologus brichardi TaxID=32507 RepID=A0A3Q4HWK2_NEOBR